MAVLLSEIQWSDPVLPAAHDVAWEAELKRRGAQVLEVDRRVAPSRWLREAAYEATNYVPVALPERLYRIGNMVTAQENACRYCYGANRAYMKVLGYSESFIQQVERDVQTAELDDKERAYIDFCRSLARSRPRPAAAERAALLELRLHPGADRARSPSRSRSAASTTASAPCWPARRNRSSSAWPADRSAGCSRSRCR